MANKPRFGSNFEVRRENRMDVLRGDPNLPDYTARSLEVRKLLQESMKETGGWPEFPQEVISVEDFLERAKLEVTKHWNTKVGPVINEKCAQWAGQLEGKEKTGDMAALLKDSATMEKKLAIHQFGVLEPLRKVLPEAWRELILIVSERQMAATVLARHWIKGLGDKEKEKFAKKIGLQKPAELEVLLDAASLFGKHINQAYVKQIELADAPGGSESTKLADEKGDKGKGVKYVYDVYTSHDGDDIDVRAYADVFPFEWARLVKNMEHFADTVEGLVKSKKLGAAYKNLPEYVRKLGAAYGSKTVETDQLHRQWQELLAGMRDLALDGCPIMLVPQQNPSVADEANKVDVELRLGFRTKEMRSLEGDLEEFRQVGEGILAELRPYLTKDHTIPPLIVNYQPYAYGPNVYWATRGEKDDEKIVAHSNAVLDVVVQTALPAFRKVFNASFSDEDFCKASLLDNSLHEIGHAVAPKKDDKVLERIGGPSKARIIEEVKADTVDQKLVLEHMRRKGGKNYEMQLYGKLLDVCDYLKNKSSAKGTSGEPYYYSGVSIIDSLFEAGVLIEDGEKYTISDWKKGIEAIADVADQILDLYTKGNPEKVEAFVQNIRDKGEKPLVKKFIARLKA